MAVEITRVECYTTTVEGQAGNCAGLLSVLAGVGVNLLGFKAAPVGSDRTRVTLIPDDGARMNAGANNAGMNLDGPHSALHIQGDEDESGACADIFEKLSRAGIRVAESCGIAGVYGSYGVIVYLEQEDCNRAMAALQD